ncbi:PhoX family protein [Nocardioides sp. B-3]|uniref:PhoX family protein n=1 Tax=Nocardioides sp. B-3 TaxID=2895565 RepID=UPI002152E1AC|nr:PhoX family protein [Nocardioides sp. B-3]
MSPRGGPVLCEDGGGTEYVHGLTTDGEIFRFASNDADLRTSGTAGKNVPANDYRGSEWAGAVFEPTNGSWLFLNIQSPGITLAITGPWRRGAL